MFSKVSERSKHRMGNCFGKSTQKKDLDEPLLGSHSRVRVLQPVYSIPPRENYCPDNQDDSPERLPTLTASMYNAMVNGDLD